MVSIYHIGKVVALQAKNRSILPVRPTTKVAGIFDIIEYFGGSCMTFVKQSTQGQFYTVSSPCGIFSRRAEGNSKYKVGICITIKFAELGQAYSSYGRQRPYVIYYSACRLCPVLEDHVEPLTMCGVRWPSIPAINLLTVTRSTANLNCWCDRARSYPQA